MKKKIKHTLLLCLMLLSFEVRALIPLEGIILGNVKDIKQYDPLEGIFNDNFLYGDKDVLVSHAEKLEKYKALYNQAQELSESCNRERFYTYSDVWKKETAMRSVAATLQYLGIDLTSKAIAQFSKIFNLSDDEYSNLVNNLVFNSCSENISVFSKKLIRNNLFKLYKEDSDFTLPSLDNSPYFTVDVVKKLNSKVSKRKEFNRTLKNFKAFCSWGGGVDNFGLLPSYLSNPLIMSYVFNHLEGKGIHWDQEQKRAYLKDSEKTVKVVCSDLICRRKTSDEFFKKFPKIVGSNSLRDDLSLLFCNDFKETTLKAREANPTLKKWINNQSMTDSWITPMNIISLITKIPDLFVASSHYFEIKDAFQTAIADRWNEWADMKVSQFMTEVLYEESLHIDLNPKASKKNSKLGEFKVVFDITLGELDRVLDESDKLSAEFAIKFPFSYLKWLRTEVIQANNSSDYKRLIQLEDNFATYIETQTLPKKAYFITPIWNKSFKKILASNLIEQLVNYKGSLFKGFNRRTYSVPVRFRFGLFALRYIRKKYQALPLTEN